MSKSEDEIMNQSNNTQNALSSDIVTKLLEQNAELIRVINLNSSSGEMRNAAPNFHVVPDLHKSIRKFSGKCSEEDASEWLGSVKGMSELHNWSDSFRLELVRSNLADGAIDWFYSLSIKNWEEFETEFTNTFIGRVSTAEQWSALLNYMQGRNENVFDYYFRKKRLCDNLKLSFSETKIQIMQGLYDRDLKTFLLCKTNTESNTLLADIRDFYRTMGAQASNRKDFGAVNIKQQKQGKDAQEILPKIKDSSDMICFRCNLKGHVKQNCTSPIVCLKCNKPGHIKKNCFMNNDHTIKKQQPGGQVTSCALVGNQTERIGLNRKYFFDATLNGKTVKSYVDFGSQCVMIRASAANELNFEIATAANDLIIRGVGGGMTAPLGLFKAKLEVDQAVADVVVYVMTDDTLDIPLLIGQPFTEQPHVSYYKRGEYLRIFEQHNLPENDLNNIYIPNLPQLKTGLWAKEAIVLPPNHVCFVAVTTNEKNFKQQDVFINSTTNRNGCVIPACIINDNAGGLAVPIVNVSATEVIFNEGEKVTKGELCIYDDEEGDCDGNNESDNFCNLIAVNTDIPNQYAEKLKMILQQYRDCFAVNLTELGCGDGTEFSIELLDDKPITYKPYRLSESERAFVREEIDQLKNAGIIVDSSSDYASPILIVRKKTGDKRICIDYRALNRVTRKIKYPLPLIADQINRLNGMKYFNVLDMRSWYYQVNVAEACRHVTAFVTPDGHYEFLRMPFGVSNGPAVFQKLINSTLGPLRFTIAMGYFDDILIPASNIDECLENLKSVLDALRRANLKLNIRKCKFLMTKVEYLGYEICDGVITPGQLKLNAIMNFKRPTVVHEVRQFIGLTSYFRNFIKGYAILAKPLTRLTKNEVTWRWDEEEEKSFNDLKKILTEAPVLSIYSKDAETEVHTDACKDGLAGM